MTKMYFMSQQSRFSAKLAIIAGTTSLFLSYFAPPGLAQWNGGNYRPTGSVGTPTRTQSGATRGAGVCPLAETTLPLVAVVPNNTFGVTVKSHPTFVFHLPTIAQGATSPPVEFVIRDLDDNDIYKARFTTNGSGGIASITLPENSGVQGLELNQDYKWSVAIICQMNDRGKDLVTEGIIQRISVPAELSPNILGNKSPLEQAELLSNASIWYDAVALMVETQRTNPSLSQWGGLLQAVGLRDFIGQPLLSNGNTLIPLDTSSTSSSLPE